jgi:hypothetical protein
MRMRCWVLCAIAVVLPGCHCHPAFHSEVNGQTSIPRSPTPIAGVLDWFPAISNFTNIDFNQNQDFKNQGVSKDRVNSVKADSVRLKIVSPNNQDFSFLDTIQFSAKAGDQEVKIAEKSSIGTLNLPPPSPTLVLDVTGAELKPYVTAPSMNIVINGRGKSPQNDTQIAITVGVQVELNLY